MFGFWDGDDVHGGQEVAATLFSFVERPKESVKVKNRFDVLRDDDDDGDLEIPNCDSIVDFPVMNCVDKKIDDSRLKMKKDAK